MVARVSQTGATTTVWLSGQGLYCIRATVSHAVSVGGYPTDRRRRGPDHHRFIIPPSLRDRLDGSLRTIDPVDQERRL